MSQHDYVIDNQSAPAFRADLNQALGAIATTNGGGTAPSVTYANQLWVDTANNQLKIRNEDNDAWIVLADLNQVNDTSAPPDASITFAKLAAATVITSSETIASNNNDTSIPTSAAVKAYADSAYVAPTTVGGIGTYAYLARSSGGVITAGTTYAGSGLRYTGGGVGANSTSDSFGAGAGATPSGTWQAMGTTRTDGWTHTLFLRIS